MKELYFDTNATTKVYPQVVKAMNKVMLSEYANPSSNHALGDRASKLVLESRTKISRAVGAKPNELYFTSGTTESNNWVFSGLAHTSQKKKILISSIEHPSIRETANLFKVWGYQIIEIPSDKNGFVDIGFIENNTDSDTLFVSVMHANNIFGTIQDLKKIGDICKRKGALFHTDAAQTIGKLKILVHDWNIDLLSASAHKIGGPKGVGILYVREGVKLSALIQGGGQEKGMRSGTENVAAIVGFAKALEISQQKNWEGLAKSRDYLILKLEELGFNLVGHKQKRLANNLFVTLNGLNAEKLLYDLSAKMIYISMGSACDSKKEVEDHALKSIGLNRQEMGSSLRISLPIEVKKTEIDYFVKTIRSLNKEKF